MVGEYINLYYSHEPFKINAVLITIESTTHTCTIENTYCTVCAVSLCFRLLFFFAVALRVPIKQNKTNARVTNLRRIECMHTFAGTFFSLFLYGGRPHVICTPNGRAAAAAVAHVQHYRVCNIFGL